MKGIKRILALVLSFVMIFTSMPIIGHAAANDKAIDSFTVNNIKRPVFDASYVKDAIDTEKLIVKINTVIDLRPVQIDGTEMIKVTNITWLKDNQSLNDNQPFIKGNSYKIIITCKAKEGYYFANDVEANINNQASDQVQYDDEKTIQIIKTFDTDNSHQPIVSIEKGEYYPTSLPNTLEVGKEIKLPLIIKNTGDADFNYNNAFTIYNTNNFIYKRLINNNDKITTTNTGLDNVCRSNTNRELTYTLKITDSDLNLNHAVIRTIQTIGTYNGSGNNNLKFEVKNYVIYIPFDENGDLGYIEEVDATTPDLVIGEMLPTDLSLFKTNDSRCYVSKVEWRNGTRKVEGDTEYSVTMTVNIANGYNGIFKNPCTMTANGKTPEQASRYNDTTLDITARIKSPVGTYNLKKEINPANSGTLTFSKDTFKYGDNVTITAKANDGYDFDQISINGKTYTDSTFTYTCNSYKDITVNAYFKAKSTCNVYFDANGGSGEMEPITGIEKGNHINTPECKFTRKNYEFDHWELPSGEAINLTSFVVNESITLKAIWKPVLVKKVEITANDPAIGESTMNVNFKQTGADEMESIVAVYNGSGLNSYTGIFEEDNTYLYEIMVVSENGFSNACTYTYNDKAATIVANKEELVAKLSSYDGKSLEIYAVCDYEKNAAVVVVCFPTLKDICTIKYISDDKSYEDKTSYDSSYTLLNIVNDKFNFEKPGYTFLGWYIDDVKQENTLLNVKTDITLTAKWKANGGGSSGGGSGSGSGSGAGGGGSTLPDDKLPQGIDKDIILFLDSYKMIIFGVEKENDVMPIVTNDRTMLPIRVIAENLGAKVEWDEKEPSIVKITKGDKVITITLGSNIAKVNDKEYELDSVAFAQNNRTYMPVRFIAENLDATVTWDEKDPNKVIITAK